VRVAAVQTFPDFLNLEGTLERTYEWLKRAKVEGVELVVFPESWLPGYPAFLDYCPGAALWDNKVAKDVFARLRENSVTVPGPITEKISSWAKEFNLVINISAHERVEIGPGNGTLYNTMLTFDGDGQLLNKHRKLMPTYTEKLLWGLGDGGGLESVQTQVGRVSGLICWEHWMPLVRQAAHDSGEDIHVAVWPTVIDKHQLGSRHYAFEGRCFVVASGCLLKAKQLPAELELVDELKGKPEELVLNGGSTIISPTGDYVTEPVFDAEGLVIGDCDLSLIDRESMTLDVSGHYARPDIFEFRIKSQ